MPFVLLPWSEALGGYLTEQRHGDPVREYLAAVAAYPRNRVAALLR